MRRLAVLSILVMSVGGCANTTDTTGTEAGLAQGLTVLTAEEGALALAYRSADVVIYMESLRGEPTPEIYQRDEGSPRFQMDAMFTDADGYAFVSQKGGDHWLDPAWGESLDRQVFDTPSAASNEVLFRLATEASATLQADIESQVGPELASQLAPEIRAIFDIASRAATVYAEELPRFQAARRARDLPEVQLAGPDADVAYGSNGPEDVAWTGGTGYYYIDIRDKSIYAFGRHSATSQYRWINSAWAFVHQNCNHGDCALSMGRKCLHQYYETNDPDDFLPSYTAPVCATGYDAWSDGGGHNCHDDTRGQTRAFINGGVPITNGYNYWCNGNDDDTDISVWPGDHSGSPECSSDCEEGYGWCP